MDKLNIRLYCLGYNKELKEYLLSQNGIKNCEFNYDNDEIKVSYDSKTITSKIIKMYIYLFLSIKIPTMISFRKSTNTNTIKHTIVIKDLCCEYCLMGMIEDLFEIDGVISAESDYDFNNKFDVKIWIEYDNKTITDEEILKLDKKINEGGFY